MALITDIPISTTNSNNHRILVDPDIDAPKKHNPVDAKLRPIPDDHRKAELIRLHGGKQEGLKVVRVNNGAITTDVAVDLGSSPIRSFDNVHTDRGWKFKNSELTAPWHANTLSGTQPFLNNFGPLAGNLAGGVHAGPISTIKVENNEGDLVDREFPLHGYLGITPASNVTVDFTDEPDQAVVLTAVHKEADHEFGEKLTHTIKYIFPMNEHRFHIEHTITNNSKQDQPVLAMYHLNQAAEKGTKIVTPLAALRARDSKSNIEGWKDSNVYEVPDTPPNNHDHKEEVSYAQLYSDANQNTLCAIVDPDEQGAVSFSYSTKDDKFPHTTFWVNDDYDGVAVEPGTNHSVAREDLIAAEGRNYNELGDSPIITIAPGDSYTTTTEVEIHADGESVSRVLGQIDEIIRSKPTPHMNTKPLTPYTTA